MARRNDTSPIGSVAVTLPLRSMFKSAKVSKNPATRQLFLVGKPSEVSYMDGAGYQLTYSYVRGNNGHLVVNYGGSSWADLGVPTGTSSVYSPTAVSYPQNGQQLTYVFAEASNGDLVANYGIAPPSPRSWADLGRPPVVGGPVENPVAITYVSGGQQQIYVFATADYGHLVVAYWNSTAPWHWADLGLPAGASGVGPPTAITWQSGGQQWIYVFATDGLGHLGVDYGLAPPSPRSWADQVSLRV